MGLDGRRAHGPLILKLVRNYNLALRYKMPNECDDDRVIDIRRGLTKQWFGKMLECVEKLPPEERAEFDIWDRERTEGVATSDWPGFAKYLPTPPWETIH
jgi:hypothetical protein